jgi:hypothetical protein
MYKLLNFPDGTESDMILRKDDSTYIPKDEANRDYQAYLEWLAEGNTPEEAE